MALNIPMPGLPGDALLKGIQTGGDLYSKIMHANQQQKENQLRPSGDVANSIYISQLENKLGPNHPAVMEAKRAHQLSLQNRGSLIDWRQMGTQALPYKLLSPTGREIQEATGNGPLERFNNNQKSKLPDGSIKVGEQDYDKEGNPIYSKNNNFPTKKQIQEFYSRKIGKQATDAAIRNKLPYAENVETTFNNLNFDDLTTYSGLKGSAEHGVDFIKAAMGNPSERFLKYNDALSTSSTLAKQLRQFWGDSIQPVAMERIESLTNPSSILKDPKVAISQLKQLKKITDQELENFRKAGKSPIEFGSIDYKNGKFSYNKNKNEADILNPHTENNEQNESNNYDENQFLKAISSQLIQVMPEATPENIKHTAEKEGKSIEQITDELLQLRDSIMEQKNGIH